MTFWLFNHNIIKYYRISTLALLRLTYLSWTWLFVAFFSALWGQTGVTTVTWGNVVRETTHLTHTVATIAGT